jgi:hypothetical protein
MSSYGYGLAQVPPLRRRFGFELLGAWVADESEELVWLLGYEGRDGFDAADARGCGSAERATPNPDPAQWFESSEQARLPALVQ